MSENCLGVHASRAGAFSPAAVKQVRAHSPSASTGSVSQIKGFDVVLDFSETIHQQRKSESRKQRISAPHEHLNMKGISVFAGVAAGALVTHERRTFEEVLCANPRSLVDEPTIQVVTAMATVTPLPTALTRMYSKASSRIITEHRPDEFTTQVVPATVSVTSSTTASVFPNPSDPLKPPQAPDGTRCIHKKSSTGFLQFEVQMPLWEMWATGNGEYTFPYPWLQQYLAIAHIVASYTNHTKDNVMEHFVPVINATTWDDNDPTREGKQFRFAFDPLTSGNIPMHDIIKEAAGPDIPCYEAPQMDWDFRGFTCIEGNITCSKWVNDTWATKVVSDDERANWGSPLTTLPLKFEDVLRMNGIWELDPEPEHKPDPHRHKCSFFKCIWDDFVDLVNWFVPD